VTSPEDPSYNCIAWAANEDDVWWWPDTEFVAYWPRDVPRKVTIDAFIQAYSTMGYAPCETTNLETGFEKIAIYVNSQGTPTHAARQLPNGFWTSKIGKYKDIEHESLQALEGPAYGSVAQILKRPIP
jgi:hypothetical protein